MTDPAKEATPTKAKLRIEIICPVAREVLDRVDIESLLQGITVSCSECWDKHDVIVPPIKVKGE